MSKTDSDSKLLYSQIKEFLTNESNTVALASGRRVGGPFSYFPFPMGPARAFDEICPGLFLGDAQCVQKPNVLKQMEITHLVNASMGSKFNQTDTNAEYYKPINISFYGIPAMDLSSFNILPYLRPAADFIENALSTKGKVYVHCQQGISRSATVVIAYLMVKKQMDVMKAVRLVREKRDIFPNDGFIKQLCQLNKELLKTQKVLDQMRLCQTQT
ncbi:dual specificity protein phosphatase 3-like [Physella acuta]|uniref:dual specificity protein phosphatase 3-like n=1 Tax=Physella acuta TaxID=109671 RepID=UPI0027DCE0E7|nr:dual specificity protein phosphatase 3-like [Physella acuta]